jgi:acyl-CoA hydrolase
LPKLKEQPRYAGRRLLHCSWQPALPGRPDSIDRIRQPARVNGEWSKRTMSSTQNFNTANPIARTVASTQSEMTEIILPNDTNTLGTLLGGRLMHFIDLTGAMAAYRHSRTHVVTAAMDHIDFIRPARLGDLITLKSSVNRAFSTSMEVGVKVWAENTRTAEVAHVASAYLVFVAIDKEGRRQKVPQLVPETPDEHRRYEDALRRREHREAESARRKEARLATAAQEDAAKIEP